MKHQQSLGILILLILSLLSCNATERTGKLTIYGNQPGASVAPGMYGVFFEEINHSGMGGLYSELIRNRDFEEGNTPSGMIERDGYIYAPHLKNYSTGAYSDLRLPWTLCKELDGIRKAGFPRTSQLCVLSTPTPPTHYV